MEELNLIELLKDSPKGTKLYSPILGECELDEISKENELINVKAETGYYTFYKKGSYYRYFGECLLFPSKNNRDWTTFKTEFKIMDHVKSKETGEVFLLINKENAGGFWAKRIPCPVQDPKIYIPMHRFDNHEYEKIFKFDPKLLEPFSMVLVRNENSVIWVASLFSHIDNKEQNPYVTIDGFFRKFCIPYNEETKSLIGTSDEEPDFYKID